MVVITQKRMDGQDGRPTNPKLVKALIEKKDLMQIPHRYYFPKDVLRNFISIKNTVLKNREAYLASGGGNKMTSVVCIVEGMSGSGKSTIASQLGLLWDPKLKLEINYAWNMKRLMYLVEHTYPGMVIVMDEAMILNSRSANSSDNLKIIIALSQIRSKGVFFIFCINSVHQLEKTIPLSRADFLIRVKRVGGLSGTPKYCIYDKDKMKLLIVKNSGKYSYSGVFPNIGWTTFSKYFPFDDVRYDKMKHRESKKNLDPKKKNQREKKYELALTRLMEYCRMNELIRTYEDFHKITDISAIVLGTQKNKFYEDLAKVDFDKLSDLIEGKKKEDVDRYCGCGARLGTKNKTGLCGECYRESVRNKESSPEEIARQKAERAELKELRKIKIKWEKHLDKKEARRLKRLQKENSVV
jgi:hypothetical protein